jgi:CBS domain-containing protein
MPPVCRRSVSSTKVRGTGHHCAEAVELSVDRCGEWADGRLIGNLSSSDLRALHSSTRWVSLVQPVSQFINLHRRPSHVGLLQRRPLVAVSETDSLDKIVKRVVEQMVHRVYITVRSDLGVIRSRSFTSVGADVTGHARPAAGRHFAVGSAACWRRSRQCRQRIAAFGEEYRHRCAEVLGLLSDFHWTLIHSNTRTRMAQR